MKIKEAREHMKKRGQSSKRIGRVAFVCPLFNGIKLTQSVKDLSYSDDEAIALRNELLELYPVEK